MTEEDATQSQVEQADDGDEAARLVTLKEEKVVLQQEISLYRKTTGTIAASKLRQALVRQQSVLDQIRLATPTAASRRLAEEGS